MTHLRKMTPEITLRLAICANGCPVGSRLERGEKMPPYQHTYALEERYKAEGDLEKIKNYIQKHHTQKPKK